VRVARTLYLIDGHSQIYRAYYAPFRNLSAPGGEPTRATYVFCQMLLNLLRDRRPDYLVMVLDADERKLLRRRIYPDYKAHRPPPPEDLLPQEGRIISILQAARVPLLREEGYEADDIIATLTRRLASAALPVCVVSRDKDLDQLLGPHVTLYDPMKDETMTAERLLELKGWRPEQAIDAQVLTGDATDNVPGVPGIGPKTAARLLQKYGSVAAVVAHADELPVRQREGLLAFAPRLEVTRQLVTLQNDVPVHLDLQQAACARFDWAAVRPIFAALGFRRLQEQLPGEPSRGESSGSKRGAGNPPSLWGQRPGGGDVPSAATLPEPLPASGGIPSVPPALESAAACLAATLRAPHGGEYHLVNTPDAFERLIDELSRQPEFAVDTETTGISPIDCDLVGVSVAWEVGRAYYVPVRSVFGSALPLETVRARLAPLLGDASKRKVGHHLKYDLNVLRGAGLPVAGPLWDTMVAAFVVDPSRGSYSLDALSLALLGHTKIPTTDLIGRGRDQLRMDQVPLERVAEYASEDADYTWRLRQLLESQLAPLGVERLFYELELPLVAVLADMENNGIALDTALLAEIGGQMAARVAAIEEQVQRLAGAPFNLDSPKQLAEVIFDRLGCRVVRRTKTTRSTDADTLAALQKETQHPIFPLLLEYREIQKLRGTYVDALPAQLSRRTGRIHTSYHQTGAVTGRLSSSEPNLQNIPIRTEAGRQIRRAFIPRSQGELLVVADYSQIELRVLAHFCEDPALMQAFVADQDIHAFVAAQVNNVPLGAVTRDMRGRAKAVNFGIVYGQTAFGLAQATGLSRTEAQAFIDAYFARYPRIREFIDRCIADARRDGLVRTILGRRRPIENLRSQNPSVRAQAERFAVNTVIQGSAADLIKTAMIQLHRRIHDEHLPLRMLLQVHDELVCEAPRSVAPPMAEIIRAVMTGAMKLRVPLKVDVACGENWLEAK
jgi:DNA polymerase-1